MVSAPVLTPFVDAAPCPRVEVFFEGFDPDTAHVTVFRFAGGREFPVRGAVMAPTAGSLSRIDFECPFNVPVTYRAEMFDSSGLSLGFTDSATLGDVIEGLPPSSLLPPDDDLAPGSYVAGSGLLSRETWMHNPLDPQGAVKVKLLDTVGQSLSRPVPGEVSYPLGRRVGVMLSEPRRGLRQVVYDVACESLEDADKVQGLIGSYARSAVPVICVRNGGDDVRLRAAMPLFLGVLDIAEEDVNVRWGGAVTNHRIVGDEVDPPIPGLVVALLRAADVNVSFATAAALNAAHLTAADVNRRYDLAGAAGVI